MKLFRKIRIRPRLKKEKTTWDWGQYTGEGGGNRDSHNNERVKPGFTTRNLVSSTKKQRGKKR